MNVHKLKKPFLLNFLLLNSVLLCPYLNQIFKKKMKSKTLKLQDTIKYTHNMYNNAAKGFDLIKLFVAKSKVKNLKIVCHL